MLPQGSQVSIQVVRECTGLLWILGRGIRTYLELRRSSVSFLLAAGAPQFHSRFDRPPLVVGREVGIPLELKSGMGPHLQIRWETWASSPVVVGNSGFL